jgi:hypothetical protein
MLRHTRRAVAVPRLRAGRRGDPFKRVLRRRVQPPHRRGHRGREAGDVRVPQVCLRPDQRRPLHRAGPAGALRSHAAALHHLTRRRLLHVSNIHGRINQISPFQAYL